MKTTRILAALMALTALPSLADVQALYWQVTSDMNNPPIEFMAAAMVADNGSTKVYLTDAGGGIWQAANADKQTTEVIASMLGQDYSSGWSFYIELQNQDSGGSWYEAGRIANSDGSNYSWQDVSSHVYSSSSMSMSLATPLTSGTAHIPEPTSGMLLLLGGALLALRRRHV